jgi:hypothetical protein
MSGLELVMSSSSTKEEILEMSSLIPRMPKIGLAADLRASVPSDDRQAAGAILHGVVECTLTLNEELRDLANAHFDTAPASSLHVLRLNRAIARVVLDWIERWPA